jgi:multidrug efflux pump subunit AcrA (membrane-fusion protein)
MAVEVRFPELPRRAPPVAVIPPSALRRSSDDRGEVFVITGNRLQRRQVQLGRDTPAGVEVRSGISAGERLVRHAAPQLQDGMSVRIRP